jgi:hydrogenase nickel incorporation protein HypA/HybF
MHELALTQYIVDAVLDKVGDAQVERVRLEIGRLSGVAVDALRFCFELVADGTPLQEAQLDIDEPPGLGHCRSCDQDVRFEQPVLLCPCGSANIELSSGQQLTIVAVEVR